MEPVNPVRFLPCEKQHFVEITITDDSVLEPQESFTVSLRRYQGVGEELQLEPDIAEISIIDNDGMCIIKSMNVTPLAANSPGLDVKM